MSSLPPMERERLSFLVDKPNMAVLQRSSYRLRQACLGETWRTRWGHVGLKTYRDEIVTSSSVLVFSNWNRYLGFSSSFSSVMYPLISKFQRVAEMAEQTTRWWGDWFKIPLFLCSLSVRSLCKQKDERTSSCDEMVLACVKSWALMRRSRIDWPGRSFQNQMVIVDKTNHKFSSRSLFVSLLPLSCVLKMQRWLVTTAKRLLHRNPPQKLNQEHVFLHQRIFHYWAWASSNAINPSIISLPNS